MQRSCTIVDTVCYSCSYHVVAATRVLTVEFADVFSYCTVGLNVLRQGVACWGCFLALLHVLSIISHWPRVARADQPVGAYSSLLILKQADWSALVSPYRGASTWVIRCVFAFVVSKSA